MEERLKKLRGPITLLCESRRFRWIAAITLTILLSAATTIIVLTQFRGLKNRLSLVSPGMTRAEVEDIFGPPALFLEKGPTGTGDLMVWVDQLWQVDVILDGNGRVIRCGCTRSYSALNRVLGRAPSAAL